MCISRGLSSVCVVLICTYTPHLTWQVHSGGCSVNWILHNSELNIHTVNYVHTREPKRNPKSNTLEHDQLQHDPLPPVLLPCSILPPPHLTASSFPQRKMGRTFQLFFFNCLSLRLCDSKLCKSGSTADQVAVRRNWFWNNMPQNATCNSKRSYKNCEVSAYVTFSSLPPFLDSNIHLRILSKIATICTLTFWTSFSRTRYFLERSSFSGGRLCSNFCRCASVIRSLFSACRYSPW